MHLFRRFILLCLVSALPSAHAAVEPWTDPTLPVKDGLGLWLDAGREEKARRSNLPEAPAPARAGPAVVNKIEGDIWHDGSGHGRHARVRPPAAAPTPRSQWPFTWYAFNGRDTALTVSAPGWSTRELTVIAMARAESNAGGRRVFLSAPGSEAGAATLEAALVPELGPKTLLSLVSAPGRGGVQTFVEGRARPRRDRAESGAIALDGLVLGALPGEAPGGRSFLDGEFLEVLVYDRALSDAERSAVEGYLTSKYAGLAYVAAAKVVAPVGGGAPFTAVKDPPLIQPLVPGFEAKKLPLALTNVNFLRYRPDGRLFAGAYNGKVYVLRDTDGDGIEDDTQLYFESKDVAVIMGMALTPPGYARGEGVFIASRNQVLLLLDKNGDNRADEVVTVASGWPPPKATAGGVSDSLGVAVAADGTVYFGLGTNDFTNAYVLDPRTGKSGYDLAGERGTVQRVSPDFSRRETVATGIRFTVGLALNRAGDLFATEQEGATWLPNGNPFDELLHIRTGLHYGFPPMHPRHLPSVIDEPSVFDYGPQHQSAVGLAFNEPVSENGPVFGPAWWRGDALVAAMSRGKIYRTQLVKTAAGYVAANSTIAQLQRIIIDQAVSPTGALAVTLHSGKPDWGTGPTGAGELWKLVPSATLPPQPVVTWSASPRELRVAFDREIGAAAFAAMRGKVRVMQGRYAQAGDRFETMRPGYQVVRNQLAAPHYDIPVSDLRLDDGGRTLVITTAERSAAVVYTISVEADAFGVGGGRPYGGQIDLQADLTGVEAEWQPAQGTPVKAWLPHPDFAVARALTAESAATRSFFSRIAETGSLLLRGQMDLGLMLYPAVQSGSKLDWSYPTEKVTVTFSATRAFRSLLGDQQLASKADGGRQIAAHTVVAGQGAWFAWNVAFASGAGDPGLTVTWTTDRSATPRPLPLRRMLLPYARAQELPPMPHNADLPQLAGGNWLRGREVFQSICATCHSFNGQGPRVGPDLANLVYRDYDSVLRDIREPSAAINPEHVGYQITKTDGSELTAVVLAETADAVTLAQVGGPAVDLPRREITAMKPLAASLMPPGLDAALEPEKLRDLMRFLLVPGLTEPAPIVLPNPPPPRPTAELEPALRAHPAPAAADKLKPLRIVLCAADKDAAHLRAGMHDYPLWRERWSALLGVAPGVVVETADRWPSTEQWQRADIVVSFHSNPAWSAERAPDIDAFLARGGGLVFLHYSINAAKDRLALAQRLGHAWGEKGNKYRIGATPIVFNAHDITKGFPLNQPVGFNDETYADMLGDLTGWSVLATSAEPSGQAPQVWLREHGKGRFFVCIPGHHTWTHDDPLYRLLVFRGMLWSAREPLGRFNELTTLGARLPQ